MAQMGPMRRLRTGQWTVGHTPQSLLQHIVPPWPCKAEQGMTTPVFCRPALNSFPTSHPFCPPGSRFLPVFPVSVFEEKGGLQNHIDWTNAARILWECRLDLTDCWNCQHPTRSTLVNPRKATRRNPQNTTPRISRRHESESDVAATRVAVSISSPPNRAGLSRRTAPSTPPHTAQPAEDSRSESRPTITERRPVLTPFPTPESGALAAAPSTSGTRAVQLGPQHVVVVKLAPRHRHGVGSQRRADGRDGRSPGELDRAQAEASCMHDLQEEEAKVRWHQAELQHMLAARPHVCIRRSAEEERSQERLRQGAGGTVECVLLRPAWWPWPCFMRVIWRGGRICR